MSSQFNCWKTFPFQAIQFSQTFLVQTIQFSTSIVFFQTLLNVKTVLFQTIQFSVNTISMSKTVLFPIIQFSISTQFSSIWPISGATTPDQSGNEGVLCIPQSSSITGTSPSYCLVISRTLVRAGSYSSAEMQSMYSTAPANWAIHRGKCKNRFTSDNSV